MAWADVAMLPSNGRLNPPIGELEFLSLYFH
jgi:hypothetical protein